MEDAEDAVQQAYLYYLLYKHSFDNSNIERLLNWLVSQESYRILKKRNGILKTRTVKIDSYDGLATEEYSGEDYIAYQNSYHSYNEGEYAYDLSVLKRAKKLYKYKINPKSLKTKYLLGNQLVMQEVINLNNPTKKSEKSKQKQLIFEPVVRVYLVNHRKKDGRSYQYYRITKV